jgi:DNA-binding transcriptional regulator YiaG
VNIIHNAKEDTLTIHLAVITPDEWRDHPTNPSIYLGYAGDMLVAIRQPNTTAHGTLPIKVNATGNPLTALRLSLGLTQSEFALVTGIAQSNIALVETGKHRDWKPEKAAKHALKRVQEFLRHRTLGSVQPDYEKRLAKMGELMAG